MLQTAKYYSIYKPFGVLSQFTPDHAGQSTLASLYSFPADVYPVGRLDRDSEGLLLLTNDNNLKIRILDPDKHVPKTYLVQVEGKPVISDLQPLESGISIRINKKQVALMPAEVNILASVPLLPRREPPIRFRKDIPDQWVEIRINEGKNRQVRKMMAQIGFPVLRLVRKQIGGLDITGMQSGDVIEWDGNQLFRRIGL